MVSTPLKNMSQNGNLPQIGIKIKIFELPPPRNAKPYCFSQDMSGGSGFPYNNHHHLGEWPTCWFGRYKLPFLGNRLSNERKKKSVRPSQCRVPNGAVGWFSDIFGLFLGSGNNETNKYWTSVSQKKLREKTERLQTNIYQQNLSTQPFFFGIGAASAMQPLSSFINIINQPFSHKMMRGPQIIQPTLSFNFLLRWAPHPTPQQN